MRRYDNGDRPRRDTDDGRGRWKVSTGKQDKEEKKVAGDGTTHYCMSVLNYFESPRGEGRKSEWLMRELTIPAYEIDQTRKNMRWGYVAWIERPPSGRSDGYPGG